MKIASLLILLSLAQLGHTAQNPQTFDIFTTKVAIESEAASSESLAVIPEPSTYALLVLSALAIAGYSLRSRHRKKS